MCISVPGGANRPAGPRRQGKFDNPATSLRALMGGPKVLISCSAPLSRRDGTSVRTMSAFRALQDTFDTRILTLDDKSASVVADPTNRTTVLHPKWRSLWPIDLVRFLLKNDFDVVVSENDWRWLPVLLLLSRLRGYKVVFDAHGILSFEMEEMGTGRASNRFNRLREKILVPRCDLVIAPSQDIESFYRGHSRRIEIVRVFVDTGLWNPARRDRPRSATKSVGIIGPFDASRNKSALEFLERNIDRFPPSIQFVVIGRCSTRIEHPRVRFTGFIESAEEYNKTISDLDAVLVVEGMATSGPLTKILEPMSHGIPVFTNPKGLMGLDFAENGSNIFVAEDGELPATMAKALADEDLMRRVGTFARELVETHYSCEKESKRLVSAISRLMEPHQKDRPGAR